MGEQELRGRLRRIVERAPAGRPAVVAVGELSIDPAHGEARWRGAELMLTPREREVLHVLAAAEGKAVRREVIYREVWGYTMARGDRSVDVNVKRLRDKLAGTAGGEVEIKTLPGVGYRLELAGRAQPVTAS
jgi:DNA-binding response OmpR family regulator